MFEILKAMLAMQAAARENGYAFTWDFDTARGDDGYILVLQVPITEEDQQFVQQMREMLG